MPLRIPVQNEYGLTADYWVITHLNVDFYRKTVEVEIGGWTSKAKFTAGYKPLVTLPFSAGGETWPLGNGSGALRRLLYDWLKTLAPFVAAVEED